MGYVCGRPKFHETEGPAAIWPVNPTSKSYPRFLLNRPMPASISSSPGPMKASAALALTPRSKYRIMAERMNAAPVMNGVIS